MEQQLQSEPKAVDAEVTTSAQNSHVTPSTQNSHETTSTQNSHVTTSSQNSHVTMSKDKQDTDMSANSVSKSPFNNQEKVADANDVFLQTENTDEDQSSVSKSLLDFPSRATAKKAFFTASLRHTLPPIDELSDKGNRSRGIEGCTMVNNSKTLPAVGTLKPIHAGTYIDK